MQRMHVFLAILIVTMGVLLTLALVSWYFATAAPSFYGSSWMSQMWGGTASAGMSGMMGNGNGATTSYFWIVPATLIAASAVAIVGVVFYLLFPQLRYIKGSSCNPQKPEPIPSQIKNNQETITVSPEVSVISNNCDVLLKTMTPEEQKVLNVLITHQGRYLQKYVGKEASLSRLKTHRIVARFAQRGIVTVSGFGNTNEILLADWVKGSNVAKADVLS